MQIKDPTILPQPLVNLIGKIFQFVLLIEKDNIDDSNDTYKVAYAWVGLEPLQSDTIGDTDVHDDLQTIDQLIMLYFIKNFIFLTTYRYSFYVY